MVFKVNEYQTPFEYDMTKAVVINKFLEERYFIKFNRESYNDFPADKLTDYFVAGEEKYTETWKGLCRRTSRTIATGYINILKHTNKITNFTNEEIVRRIVELENKFYENMYTMKFIPSSPFMMNALSTYFEPTYPLTYDAKSKKETYKRLLNVYTSTDNVTYDIYNDISQYKNGKCAFGSCYSMGLIEDTLKNDVDGIYDMLLAQAEIFRAAGGVGFNFSKLRSSKAPVRSIRGKSSGAVKFMNLFNEPTNVIALTSSKKRGANMFILNVNHPDIIEFINAKTDKEDGYKNLDKANISVGINEDFMNKLKERLTNENVKFTLVDPAYPKITEEIDPLRIWDNIITNSVLHAEPGMVFFDNINKMNSIPSEVKNCTNPCGEYIAADKTVCTLGSINLYAMYKNGQLDTELLYQTMQTLTEFLSLSIFTNDYPLSILKERSIRFRPIGIGLMGLDSINIISNHSVSIREIFLLMMKGALETSANLAKEFSAFDDYDKSVFKQGKWVNGKPISTYVSKESADIISKFGLFNAYFFAIAPTGSISFIADVSSGIEPVFALKTIRYINKGEPSEYEVVIYDQAVLKYYAKKLFPNIDELTPDQVKEVKAYIDKLPKNNTEIKTAMKMSPVEHILPLIEISDLIDMNSSKTINLSKDHLFDNESDITKINNNVIKERPITTISNLYPEYANILNKAPIIDTNLLSSKQIISDIYFIAHTFGLKGITTYTEGSRSPVIKDANDEDEDNKQQDYIVTSPTRYYKICAKLKLVNGGKIYIDLGVDKNRNPFKLLIKESKEVRKSSETSHFVEINNLIGRAISTSLKSNIPIKYILEQIKKVETYDIKNDKYVYSPYVTLIATVIEELVEIAKSNNTFDKADKISNLETEYTVSAKGYLINKNGQKVCPICKTPLDTSAGCETCSSCGWGAC